MSALPKKITDLAVAIRDAGGRAMLNGGCVRDELMGIQPKDWDVEVYGVEPVKLKTLLESFAKRQDADEGVRVSLKTVGEAFAVYKLAGDIDVSLPRRERKSGSGHRGFVVEGDSSMSFEEACS
ncbi:MAG: hypothetical protein HOP17_05215, partial [Acidobacteria bacterium]|nr:hypothetical protein [Acidobacteriota bacterium]